MSRDTRFSEDIDGAVIGWLKGGFRVGLEKICARVFVLHLGIRVFLVGFEMG